MEEFMENKIDKKNIEPDLQSEEHYDEEEKELMGMIERKKFQNKVFEKIINQLNIKHSKK
ncbi:MULTISPECIES: hypothetical protein [unclassified Lentimicrobium]|uniref:hypothetical protein n=1 Tax=unclassified Lentimicrobium TaxID=2677434 RepID=UPI001552ADAC|nr:MULTISPECIES: hypothetical protein [unclassified Lentimicrobium]NPD47892.1 hypothetical protein [Lentimicrobium sp. S6]NPD86531.1 hypothetical protein [Lentimicrobium sp. L6]